MNVDLKETKMVHAADVARVFEQSGIRRPYQDIARIQHMIDHADLLVTAWVNNHMIGVARALTDFCYCCYLSDLAVDTQYQGQGIGKKLIERVQRRIGDETALILLSAPEAMQFYPKLGFERSERAYIIPRKR